MRPNYFR